MVISLAIGSDDGRCALAHEPASSASPPAAGACSAGPPRQLQPLPEDGSTLRGQDGLPRLWSFT